MKLVKSISRLEKIKEDWKISLFSFLTRFCPSNKLVFLTYYINSFIELKSTTFLSKSSTYKFIEETYLSFLPFILRSTCGLGVPKSASVRERPFTNDLNYITSNGKTNDEFEGMQTWYSRGAVYIL
jgi:hypothetical protein